MTDTRFSRLIHNRHQGERAVIVANGPSLNEMDLSFLKHEITFGLNKIYLGFKKFNFYPRYYVAVNRKVIEQSAEQIRKLNCVKFISDKGNDLVQRDALTYRISTKKPEQQFYKDIAQGVNEGWTVTYAALQVAYYMGFTEVILIGLDHRYVYSGDPNQSDILSGPDPNHSVMIISVLVKPGTPLTSATPRSHLPRHARSIQIQIEGYWMRQSMGHVQCLKKWITKRFLSSRERVGGLHGFIGVCAVYSSVVVSKIFNCP